MARVIQEVPQLSDRDCFYVVERFKSEFTFPIHSHKELEIIFVQNCEGVQRIVGDSIEALGYMDLVMIGGENLEHAWLQGECKSKNIREITIQFSPTLFSEEMLSKNQFSSLRTMFSRAKYGISFPQEAIMKVYGHLDELLRQDDGFVQFQCLLTILYELSKFDCKVLSSSSFIQQKEDIGNSRITKVTEYLSSHFTEDIKLPVMATLAGMSQSAFSRAFHRITGKTFSEYVIDLRIGQASRMLVDDSVNVSEICYACGFNNLSNFNRLFKARKGLTPSEFKKAFRKTRVII